MCRMELFTDPLWFEWRSCVAKYGHVQENKNRIVKWEAPVVKDKSQKRIEIKRNILGFPKYQQHLYLNPLNPLDAVSPNRVSRVLTQPSRTNSRIPRLDDVMKLNRVKSFTFELRAENEADRAVDQVLGDGLITDIRTKLMRCAVLRRLEVLSTPTYRFERHRNVEDRDQLEGLTPKLSMSGSKVEMLTVRSASLDGIMDAESCQFAYKVYILIFLFKKTNC